MCTMDSKSETSTSKNTRMVAILTKEWSYNNLQSETTTVVPAGTEYTFGKYSNTQLLPNGNLRWFYWDIPKENFRVCTEEVVTTTTVTVKRFD